jgi:predicted amidohydrolase
MKSNVRVCAVSVDSQPQDAEGNRKKIIQWTERAANQGSELVVFPELSLCGFVPNHPLGDHAQWLREALKAARAMAEPVPGPSTDLLVSVAQQFGLYCAAGLLEDAGNVLYNSYILVGPNGLLGRWRKMHIPMFEMPFYVGGDGPTVVDTPLGRIGSNICFDALMPESTRLLAVQNAEIVLFPFAADPASGTPADWAAWASPPVRARCQENGVFGVCANYVGRVCCAGVDQTFPGGALTFGPRGEVISQWLDGCGQAGMLTANLHAHDLAAARCEPEYLFRFRRPELYRPLSK